jgi:hypothetical protein
LQCTAQSTAKEENQENIIPDGSHISDYKKLKSTGLEEPPKA